MLECEGLNCQPCLIDHIALHQQDSMKIKNLNPEHVKASLQISYVSLIFDDNFIVSLKYKFPMISWKHPNDSEHITKNNL